MFYINKLIILTALIIFFFSSSLIAVAQSAPAPAFSRDEGRKCITAMDVFLETERKEFGEFITTHFRSNLPTSELIPTAIERYRQYRKDVRAQLQKFLPKGGVANSGASTELSSCTQAVQEEFMLISGMIRQHAVENAYAKKTTRLMLAYKNINDGLNKLNFTLAQLFGYFGAFSQKLPCYPTQCTKG